jgi:hypothetical protein
MLEVYILDFGQNLHKKWNCIQSVSVTTNQLKQFRNEVYQNFNNCKRTDMLMDLVDALSSNTTARSVVELSLNPHFRRHYTALNKAVTVNALKALLTS